MADSLRALRLCVRYVFQTIDDEYKTQAMVHGSARATVDVDVVYRLATVATNCFGANVCG